MNKIENNELMDHYQQVNVMKHMEHLLFLVIAYVYDLLRN